MMLPESEAVFPKSQPFWYHLYCACRSPVLCACPFFLKLDFFVLNINKCIWKGYLLSIAIHGKRVPLIINESKESKQKSKIRRKCYGIPDGLRAAASVSKRKMEKCWRGVKDRVLRSPGCLKCKWTRRLFSLYESLTSFTFSSSISVLFRGAPTLWETLTRKSNGGPLSKQGVLSPRSIIPKELQQSQQGWCWGYLATKHLEPSWLRTMMTP